MVVVETIATYAGLVASIIAIAEVVIVIVNILKRRRK